MGRRLYVGNLSYNTTEMTLRDAFAAAAATATLLGLVDVDGAPIELAAIELLDRRLGLLVRAHLDEGEATRTAGVAIHHDLRVGDGPDLPEGVAQSDLGGVVRKIPNVKASTHLSMSPVSFRRKQPPR